MLLLLLLQIPLNATLVCNVADTDSTLFTAYAQPPAVWATTDNMLLLPPPLLLLLLL
jgi:hypothetical protein